MRRPSFLLLAIVFACCIALAKGVQQIELSQRQHRQSSSAEGLEDAERRLVPLAVRDGSLGAGFGGTPWNLRLQD
jgi:hypothetical protein